MAIYDSQSNRKIGAAPCIHKIAIQYDEELHQEIETKCSLCGTVHNFILDKKYVVETPNEIKRFKEFVFKNLIEVLTKG